MWNFIVTHNLDEAFWIAIGAGSLWILDKIFPELIKFSYNQRLELFKRRILQQEKVSIISELTVLLKKQELTQKEEDRANQIMIELALYLPRELVFKLAHTLKCDKTPEDVGWSVLFGDIRDFMNGNLEKNRNKEENKKVDRVIGNNISFISLPKPKQEPPSDTPEQNQSSQAE